MIFRCCAVGLVWTVSAATAPAESLPLWEAGIGAAIVDFPDYRGANERHTYAQPFPYLEYRGEFLKADRERVRGVLFARPGTELNLSINGTTPVNSADNQARAGMPYLDLTLEVGPNLEVNVWRGANGHKLDLRLPLRAVIATNFRHAQDAGWVFQPQLNADFRNLGSDGGWQLGVAAGPLFATRRNHQYFYRVESQFATSARPTYDASGGYSGTQFIAALSKRFPEFWIGAFARYDRLNGAAFVDSPLVKSREAFSAGLAVSWIFARSREWVEAEK